MVKNVRTRDTKVARTRKQLIYKANGHEMMSVRANSQPATYEGVVLVQSQHGGLIHILHVAIPQLNT